MAPPAVKRERGQTPAGSSSTAVKREAGSSTTAPIASKPAPTFRDFPIFSSHLAPNTRINLLRFGHHTTQDPTDPTQFVAPLKLNRKWPPRPKPNVPKPGDPVRDVGGSHVVGFLPTTAENEKPKKGKLYWPSYGEGGLEEIRKALHIPPELNISAFPPQPKDDNDDDDDDDEDEDADGPGGSQGQTKASQGSSNAKKPQRQHGFRNGMGGSGGKGKRGSKNSRSIREVHKASESTRLLRRQEYMPWVLEDFETGEEWESNSQAAHRYKTLVAQFGEQYSNCAGNAGLVQMYLRGAVEHAQQAAALSQAENGDDDASGLIVKEEDAKKKKRKAAGFMDRNHAPWIGKLEGDVHGSLITKSPAGSSNGSLSNGGSGPSVSSSPHVIFVFDHRHDGSFKLVPVHAAYKFTQKPAYSITTADEANERWEALNKLRQRGGSAYQKIPVSNTKAGGDDDGSGEGQGEGAKAMLAARNRQAGVRRSGGGGGGRLHVKKEEEEDNAELANWSSFQQRSAHALALPGFAPSSRPRSLLAVYGDRSAGRGAGGGGGAYAEGGAFGEVEYEEEFADDEEIHQGPGAENLQEEQEQKEFADRLKEEMARAGFDGELGRRDRIDSNSEEDDDDDDGGVDLFGDRPAARGMKASNKRKRGAGGGRDGLGRSGREIKKVMRMAGRADGFDAYDSEDDEANPYASEEEEESDTDEEKHLALTNPEEAVRRAREARREKEEREAAAKRKAAAQAERDGTPFDSSDVGAAAGASSQHDGSNRPGAGSSGQAGGTASRPPPPRATSGVYIPRRAGSSSPPPVSPQSPSRQQAGGSGGLKVTLKRKSEAMSAGSGRATSPVGGGSQTSPPTSRAGSPSAPDGHKRQKVAGTKSGGAASPAGSRAGSPSASAGAAAAAAPRQPANDVEREVIRLLKEKNIQTTQELVRYFAKLVKEPGGKEKLSMAIKAVCRIERGTNKLMLRTPFE
ncbi:transcription factor IIF subunit tfg1 [Tilletia horrida]|uniref:Transcription factor IIF subunit tfg1 n=1 Tax=Tilletia horrida TaxID=155126 RepID=A0AAN6JYQ1_9BASI|nr:transcription factor IIF subunit tfg1 [Tilletia horrida]KAK0553054.1 transcription factor IIF subunit tfg1 [Tilletia horrida]KAK0569708.1 transcription factor IIF subunit tfg1 [Tilletia horrida]